jgi:hypothetical protein
VSVSVNAWGAAAIISEMPEAAIFRFPPGPPTMAGDAVYLRRSATKHVDLLIEASRDPEIIRWTRMPENLDHAAATSLLNRWRGRARDGILRQYVIARDGMMLVGLAIARGALPPTV